MILSGDSMIWLPFILLFMSKLTHSCWKPVDGSAEMVFLILGFTPSWQSSRRASPAAWGLSKPQFSGISHLLISHWLKPRNSRLDVGRDDVQGCGNHLIYTFVRKFESLVMIYHAYSLTFSVSFFLSLFIESIFMGLFPLI